MPRINVSFLRMWGFSAWGMEKAIMILILEIELKTGDYSIQIMVEIGIVEIIGMGTPLGIIGTMFIVLYFSRKQAQGFTVDIETMVLNDLEEKVRKMADSCINWYNL